MKRASFAAAFAACVLTTIPAQAQQAPFALRMSGGQFLELCTNPPEHGGTVFAMCQMYVAGIADTLKAENRICFGPMVTQAKLFSTAAWWIDSRPREGYAVGVMIRNGLLNAYRCQVAAQRRNYAGPSDARLEHDAKMIALMKEAAKFVLLFAH
jgi:Rap1a immunity proteins